MGRPAPPVSLIASIPPIWITMGKIFLTLFAVLFALSTTLTRAVRISKGRGEGTLRFVEAKARFLADAKENPSKHHAEIFILKYSAVWILSVGVVIASRAYEWWGRWGYIVYCGACAAPYVVTPLLRPLKGDRTPAGASSIATWYILKANAWIAVFSFIGNYWYTHYFYGVLKANYTFDAHRLNDVPISMYLMTHAYFMFYHALTNCALRFVKNKYEDDAARWVFTCALVAVMAYTTAFMESLTICGFPYYTFADRDKAYTLGSAFYGIYFLVSFPMFLRVDEDVVGGGKRGGGKGRTTHWTTFWEAMGSGMAVLCLLDFVRVHLGLDFCMYAKGH